MDTKSQLADLGLFDAKVPRYTSYPTAPHFSREVGADAFSSWISSVAPGSNVSLYVHVPFCRRLCWFCACRTQGTQTDAPVIAYLETLKTEIAMLGRLLPAGVRLSRLHWGGGTPTLLQPSMMTELAGAIREIAPFTEATEFSVEIDPGEIDGPRLDALAAAGMNRASIGVQDFDDEIQKTIGRLQSYDITRDALGHARAWRGQPQRRHPLRPAAPDPRAHDRERAEAPVAQPRPRGAVRICACTLDGQAPADDSLRRPAHPAGAPRALRHGPAAVSLGRL